MADMITEQAVQRAQQQRLVKDYEKDTSVRVIDLGYRPRPFQAKIHTKLKRFNVLVCHRRFGKTVLSKAEIGDRALVCPHENPQYAYIAPTYTQAERVAWKYFKDAFRELPGFISNEQKLRITFDRPDKGDVVTILLLGADNPDSIRGIYLDGVVMDEYAQCEPRIFGEIIRPLLADRKGWAIFIGTPKGQNHFYDMFQHAQMRMQEEKSTWYACVYKASMTKVLDAEELNEARLSMSREQYEQEFECSFTAALTGAYYGEAMAAIEAKGQIKDFLYDPKLTVTTAWDLGIDDSTAIWFVQTLRDEVRVVDYYEVNGKGLPDIIKHIKALPYTYEEHLLPHDAGAREMGTGVTREETMRTLGLSNTRVCARQGVEDGINAVRLLLPRCWFILNKTSLGQSALKNYQRKYDGKNKLYMNKALHDWSSHGSDAFRTLAMNLRGGSHAKRLQELKRFSTYD